MKDSKDSPAPLSPDGLPLRIPDKLIFRLDEVCRLTGLKPADIETWEAEFDFLQSGLTASGQKIFRQRDIAILIRLKDLLEEKRLTAAGARRRIEAEFKLPATPPAGSERLRKTILAIREELEDILITLKSSD